MLFLFPLFWVVWNVASAAARCSGATARQCIAMAATAPFIEFMGPIVDDALPSSAARSLAILLAALVVSVAREYASSRKRRSY